MKIAHFSDPHAGRKSHTVLKHKVKQIIAATDAAMPTSADGDGKSGLPQARGFCGSPD